MPFVWEFGRFPADDDDDGAVAVDDVGDAAGCSIDNNSELIFFSSPLISEVGVVEPFVVEFVADTVLAAFAHAVEQYGFFLSFVFDSDLPQCSHLAVSDFSGDSGDKMRRLTKMTNGNKQWFNTNQ